LVEEKALLGFYVTGHPLDDDADLLTAFSTHSIIPVRQFKADKGVRVGGLITSVATKISKRDGRTWAIIGIEDMDGTIECLCYSESYAKFLEHIRQDAKVFIEGFVNRRDDDEISTIVVNKVIPFEASKQEFLKEIHVTIDEGNGMASRFGELKDLLASSPGPTPVVLALKLKTGDYAFVEAGRGYYVELTDMLECSLKSMSGRDRLVLKGNRHVEDRKPRRWSGKQ
jgi:DNA polymerase-3 subunit alpha